MNWFPGRNPCEKINFYNILLGTEVGCSDLYIFWKMLNFPDVATLSILSVQFTPSCHHVITSKNSLTTQPDCLGVGMCTKFLLFIYYAWIHNVRNFSFFLVPAHYSFQMVALFHKKCQVSFLIKLLIVFLFSLLERGWKLPFLLSLDYFRCNHPHWVWPM